MADHPSPSLWRHRDFRLLWGGQTVSELGTQVSFLAVPLVAIDVLHASTFGVGVLTAMQTLPFLLVGLPAGAWVDRMARRPVLIAADVGRAIALGSIPAAWALSVLTLAQLYLVSLVAGVLTVFFDVAYQSYLPALVGTDSLVDGNAKLAATESGARVAGPAVAGALVSALGAAVAVLADAASFVVSFVSLMAIRAPEPEVVAPAAPVGEAGRIRRLRREIAEGLAFVWREPRIRSVAGSTGTSNFFGTMALSIVLVFLRRQLDLSPGRIGVLFAVGSVGGIAGALAARRLAERFGVGRTILWTIAVAGVGQLSFPLASHATATVLIIAGEVLVSGGGVAYNITQVSLRQALCPPRLLGRMNASVRFMVWGTMPLGAFAGGVLGSTIGLRPTLWVAAAGSLAAFLWILLSPVPKVRTIPTGDELAAIEAAAAAEPEAAVGQL